MNIKYLIHKHKKLIFCVGVPIISLAFSRVAMGAEAPLFSITTMFGEHDSLHQTVNGHSGVDIAVPIGTPLTSLVDGEVTKIVDAANTNYGLAVHIKESGTNKEVIFGHLSEVKVHLHEHVNVGELVALSGNSGASSGAHTHVQIRLFINGKPVNIDPMPTIMKAAIGGK